MKSIATALAALCLTATSAAAAPIQWDLNYSNGIGAAIGSFVYDADIDTYSDINVALLEIGTVNNSVADTVVGQLINSPGTPDENNEVLFGSSSLDLTGTLRLSFNTQPGSLFSNAGGVIDLGFIGFSRCFNSDCSDFLGITNASGTGVTSLTGTPVSVVPLPASGALLFGGLAWLGWHGGRRRRSANGVAMT